MHTCELVVLAIFRNWFSAIRVLAWVTRFVNNCRSGPERTSGALSLNELVSAERLILRLVQKVSFPEELDALRSRKGVSGLSKLSCLNVLLDEDLLLQEFEG